jgi:RimJ/RimL family protein N-acetyltransferase
MRFGFGMYLIVPRPGELAVGDIGFHRPPKDGDVEIGFGMVESARGQGYATEAARALTQWAFAQPGVRRVVARTTADNAGALGVLRRLGFRHDHTREDFQQYVLLPVLAG